MRILTKADKVLILIIFIISILGIIGTFLLQSSNLEEKYVVIKINNKLIEKIPINNDTETTYSFYFNNEVGTIEISNGTVRMKKMDRTICPNQICSDTGWISKTYENIVCLPNRIIVTIEENTDAGIDIIS